VLDTGLFAGCSGGSGVLGSDVAGTVVKTGTGCHLKVGDRAWADENGFTSPGEDSGGMADFAVVNCVQAGVAPSTINLTAAGTIPTSICLDPGSRSGVQIGRSTIGFPYNVPRPGTQQGLIRDDPSAGTIPLAGLTSLEALRALGAPWSV
jgi:hypothetical protein